MVEDIVDLLVCPVCRDDLALRPGVLRCARGHSFDVARQGYVSLLTGSRAPGTADTAAMVAARERFLGAGHYAPLAGRLAEVVRAALPASTGATPPGEREGGPGGTVVDAGAGTGYYLAAALTGRARGVALDISKYAARRAARAHPRIGAVVADLWRPLPLRDACADVVINVFAPRNGPEFARVLRPGGRLVVVTPERGHLDPLVGLLGLLSVDEDKERRVARSLGAWFREVDRGREGFSMSLGPEAVEAAVSMGPSAWHADPEPLRERIGALPNPVTVTASFRVSVFERA
ncbi:putative RNA methyltransferase [Thermostaphylospora chromogena]|uniref:23S rRNA m(1)G-748 methyltransferase n=1 Tax=Thermostaphylospora chromogena TaxID=35622 RepID=A0A1H1D6E3_9ACTN|nr:methyltransferase domain-containing protein [Thermostaphylospora chromogena]SDQ72023.1 23S rRNA m(1)G-748 methyltransferase [Thermostaphylospora chromogena]